jgi:hypothetical protein
MNSIIFIFGFCFFFFLLFISFGFDTISWLNYWIDLGFGSVFYLYSRRKKYEGQRWKDWWW